MTSQKSIKVIFDTNIWISFLIGKRLQSIKDQITTREINIVLCDHLLTEIKVVTQRTKLRKYFPSESVSELIEFLEAIGETYQIKLRHKLSRDAKDNFLLDLIEKSKADYLITGDKDLLELNPFMSAKILSPAEFEREVL
ncbi:MAG: putative toxin-antitoxin system toxin component, PIN family [Bacteroidetes bacterium]|nr:putative toxin-antitoxin system toxin component, PIN family [Bacteroidota bacterium]